MVNDDGIDSPELIALAAAAVQADLNVVVAAPRWQSSGTSAGIIVTVRQGRTLIERRQLADLPGVEAYSLEAQPGYIVLAAVRGWLDPAPELVLSGINYGANVGRALLHSGTVGAALTAGVNGRCGLAVSLDVGPQPPATAGRAGDQIAGAPHWDTAVHLLPGVLELLTGAPPGTVLTLNAPDRPVAALRELRCTTLAEFGAVQTRVDRVDNGQLHLVDVEVDTPPATDTDSALLAAGYPTLTALESVGEASSPVLSQWLETLG
ncbi:MAG: 5'/3'-nucleotidase SurE [Actinomycetota bacterium]|nr:5'/3'-nucleotidase SurE [Actinomycetota bacterium]